MASTRPLNAASLFSYLVSQLRVHVRPHSRVCVGLSGGRDSVVLLHLVWRAREELAINISAIHVNHQISPNANRWADFCVAICTELDVPLRVECVEVARDSGKGLEASARHARYAVYANTAADAILLGHHRDDQTETILLQALRGAGLGGISGMPLVKPFGAHKEIIRPLLDVAPRILADYAIANNLKWIHDESNDDTHYTRNFLRHDVLPLLAERIPQSVASLVRLGQHAAEAQILLDDLAAIDRTNVLVGARLSVSRLICLPRPRAKNLLRFSFAKAAIALPNAVQLEEMINQLTIRRPDDQTNITWADWQLRCYQDEIYLSRKTPNNATHWSIDWQSETELSLPNACGMLRVEKIIGAGISANRLAGKKLTVRSRVGGEKYRLSALRPRRSLKNLLQEANVPPWRRETIPLMFCDDVLIWVPGIGMDIDFVAQKDEPGLVFSWHTDSE